MINRISNINFSYRSKIKSIAPICAYGGEKFTKRNPSTYEHLVPHSKGGPTKDSNCLAVTHNWNQLRGNMDFIDFINKFPIVIKNIQKYLDIMRGIDPEYTESVKRTINNECHGEVVFKGRKSRT